MQALDFPQIKRPAIAKQKLLAQLQDICNQVKIDSNFCLRHRQYKPWKLPDELVTRLQKIPEQMQQKYLSLQLRSFLYGIYYNGSMRKSLAPDSEENKLPIDLENNTLLGVDVEFYQQLHQSNAGIGYFEPGWKVLREENDGTLAVTKGSLRLHIEPDKHLQSSQPYPQIDEEVAIFMPKNRVQNGFYLAVSNWGFQRLKKDNVTEKSVTVRIYFNLTPEGAVAVMGSLTGRLNEMAIPFSFKVLYNPQDYQRHDSGVLYFDKSDYGVVKEVLEAIYQENQLHFKSEVPLFTLQLAPGLGLAEEPEEKFAAVESFGMNRCQIVANGLLEAWQQGDNSSSGRMKAIFEQFSLLGIEWQRVYLNAYSEDIYTLLELGN